MRKFDIRWWDGLRLQQWRYALNHASYYEPLWSFFLPKSSYANVPYLVCLACAERRQHTIEEWTLFHPDAGKGYSRD